MRSSIAQVRLEPIMNRANKAEITSKPIKQDGVVNCIKCSRHIDHNQKNSPFGVKCLKDEVLHNEKGRFSAMHASVGRL